MSDREYLIWLCCGAVLTCATWFAAGLLIGRVL
jgi:hypothetical protein